MPVLASKALFLSQRILFFWGLLRGKLSCFHVKGVLLSVCFPGCLKLFTAPEGLSVCACVCECLLSVSRRAAQPRMMQKDLEIRHLRINVSVDPAEKLSAPGTEWTKAASYLSLITESCHWSSTKCWHKISQMCRWPFPVFQIRAGERYKSWQSMWWKLFHLDISGTSAHRFLAFRSRHQRENVTFFIYLREYTN